MYMFKEVDQLRAEVSPGSLAAAEERVEHQMCIRDRAEDREEAESMVAEDCGLVLGGNIHTTRDDDEVTDWKFGCHPD